MSWVNPEQQGTGTHPQIHACIFCGESWMENQTPTCRCAEVINAKLVEENQRLREALQYAVDSKHSNDPLCCPVCRTWSTKGNAHSRTCWYSKAKKALGDNQGESHAM